MQWFTILSRWLRPTPALRPDLHIILYTRTACPLCDEARILLEDFQTRHGFVLESKNVDASDELQHAYGNCVPVVTINGRLRFRGHINPALLQRILDAGANAASPE